MTDVLITECVQSEEENNTIKVLDSEGFWIPYLINFASKITENDFKIKKFQLF